MQISRIGYQPDFKGYFNNDITTVSTLNQIYKEAEELGTVNTLFKRISVLKNFYPEDVYTLTIKKAPDGKYLSMVNKRTDKELYYSCQNQKNLYYTFKGLTTLLLRQEYGSAIRFVTGDNFIKYATSKI